MGSSPSKEDCPVCEECEECEECKECPPCDCSATATAANAADAKETDWATECPKNGYIKKDEKVKAYDAQQMFKNLMDSFGETSKKDEKVKATLNNLLYEYKPFVAPKGGETPKTVDDAIEMTLGSIMTLPESVLAFTLPNIIATYGLDRKTQLIKKQCQNTATDDRTFNSVATLIKGSYVYLAAGLIYSFYKDFNEPPQKDGKRNANKLFYEFTTTETANGPTNDKAKFNEILKKEIKDKVKTLWQRLFCSFWLPRLLDIKDVDLKVKLLMMYEQVLTGRSIDGVGKAGIVSACEDHVKDFLIFLIFVEVVISKKYDTKNSFNLCNNCYLSKYVNETVKEFKNLNITTKTILPFCYGLLFDASKRTNGAPNWDFEGIQPDEVKKIVGRVEKSHFQMDKVFFGIEGFEPVGVAESCSYGCNGFNKLGSIVLIITVMLIFFACVRVLILRHRKRQLYGDDYEFQRYKARRWRL